MGFNAIVAQYDPSSFRPPVWMPSAPFEVDRVLADERALVERAQQGDRPAFAVLIERYWDGVYRWLYHLSRHRHTAEDLTQETFLKAFAALASFRAGTNFRAWLFRIAFNALVNQKQADARAREPLPENLPAAGQGPLDQVLGREALETLAQAVSRLQPDFRTALLLRAEQGLSFQEIARVLGTTEETARWRVFKARQKLMAMLTPRWGETKP
jgi:RNA polymerase sigma-70 factor (ECF subfamily)